MSKTQLQTNNAKLSALITELQGKAAGGGGGGDGNINTCTVNITLYSGYLYGYVSTRIVDGAAEVVNEPIREGVQTTSIDNVSCGTSLVLFVSGISVPGKSVSSGIASLGQLVSGNVCVFEVLQDADGTETIEIYDNV